MTYQEYQDELASISEAAQSLKTGLDFFTSKMVGLLSRGSDAVELQKCGARFCQISKDLTSLNSYRYRLAMWFWNSRVGNPPRLR